MQNLKAISPTSTPLLTGLFKDHQSAESAYQDLLDRGYKKEDIHLFMSEETRNKYFPDIDNTETQIGSKALQGAGVGSSIGGALGAIAAGIIAIGTTLAIPGLGLVVAGPLAAGLAGAGAGGLVGGAVGALVGAGIPDDKAKIYEAGLKSGGIVVGVSPCSTGDSRVIESRWKELKSETIFTS